MYDRRRVRCVRRPGGRVYIPTGWTPPEPGSRFNRRDRSDSKSDRGREVYIGASRNTGHAAARPEPDRSRSAGSPVERFRKHTRQESSVRSTKSAGKQSGHGRFRLRHGGSRSQDAAPASAETAGKNTPQTDDGAVSRSAAPTPPPSYDGAVYPPYYPQAVPVPVFYPAYPQPYSVYDHFTSMLTDEELAELSEVEDYEDRYGRDFDRYAD